MIEPPEPPLRRLVLRRVETDHPHAARTQSTDDAEVETAQVPRHHGEVTDTRLDDRDELGDVGAAPDDRRAAHLPEGGGDR